MANPKLQLMNDWLNQLSMTLWRSFSVFKSSVDSPFLVISFKTSHHVVPKRLLDILKLGGARQNSSQACADGRILGRSRAPRPPVGRLAHRQHDTQQLQIEMEKKLTVNQSSSFLAAVNKEADNL